jgi:hypothetical protein
MKVTVRWFDLVLVDRSWLFGLAEEKGAWCFTLTGSAGLGGLERSIWWFPVAVEYKVCTDCLIHIGYSLMVCLGCRCQGLPCFLDCIGNFLVVLSARAGQFLT